jgi:hypothetical protein
MCDICLSDALTLRRHGYWSTVFMDVASYGYSTTRTSKKYSVFGQRGQDEIWIDPDWSVLKPQFPR